MDCKLWAELKSTNLYSIGSNIRLCGLTVYGNCLVLELFSFIWLPIHKVMRHIKMSKLTRWLANANFFASLAGPGWLVGVLQIWGIRGYGSWIWHLAGLAPHPRSSTVHASSLRHCPGFFKWVPSRKDRRCFRVGYEFKTLPSNRFDRFIIQKLARAPPSPDVSWSKVFMICRSTLPRVRR